MDVCEVMDLLTVLARGNNINEQPSAPMQKALDQMVERLRFTWILHWESGETEYIYAESEQDLHDILFNNYDKTDWHNMKSVTRLNHYPLTPNGESPGFTISTTTNLIMTPIA